MPGVAGGKKHEPPLPCHTVDKPRTDVVLVVRTEIGTEAEAHHRRAIEPPGFVEHVGYRIEHIHIGEVARSHRHNIGLGCISIVVVAEE